MSKEKGNKGLNPNHKKRIKPTFSSSQKTIHKLREEARKLDAKMKQEHKV